MLWRMLLSLQLYHTVNNINDKQRVIIILNLFLRLYLNRNMDFLVVTGFYDLVFIYRKHCGIQIETKNNEYLFAWLKMICIINR